MKNSLTFVFLTVGAVIFAGYAAQAAEQKGTRTERSIVQMTPAVAQALRKYASSNTKRRACLAAAFWSVKFVGNFHPFVGRRDQQYSCDVERVGADNTWRISGQIAPGPGPVQLFQAEAVQQSDKWCRISYRLDGVEVAAPAGGGKCD